MPECLDWVEFLVVSLLYIHYCNSPPNPLKKKSEGKSIQNGAFNLQSIWAGLLCELAGKRSTF